VIDVFHVPPRHALLAVALAAATLLAAPAFAAPTYVVTQIAPDGYTASAVNALNNSGAAVGYYNDANFTSHAYFAASGGLTTLQDLGYGAAAQSVNDHNQIVGSVKTADGHTQAAFWASPTAAPTLIGSLGTGTFSNAYGINNDGVVVGNSQYATGHTYQHGFVYTVAGGMVDYGSLDPSNPAEYSTFAAVNDRGQIVGTTFTVAGHSSPSTAERATVGAPGVFTNADTGYTNLVPVGINSSGVAVGHSATSLTGLAYRFDTDDTATALDLGNIGVDLAGATANAINDEGDIVGGLNGTLDGATYFTNFVMIDGVAYDLYADTTNAAGWSRFNAATDINDSGLISGSGLYDGVLTGYLLTAVPDVSAVPEPSTLALMGLGGAAMFLRRKRAR
jgi:probable HAF family extracellular repeat protein